MACGPQRRMKNLEVRRRGARGEAAIKFRHSFSNQSSCHQTHERHQKATAKGNEVPTAFHVNRNIGRACRVVCQTSKYGLRATEDFHSLRSTPVNSFANELDCLHGAAWKRRSLVRGNPHKNSSPRKRGCVDHEYGQRSPSAAAGDYHGLAPDQPTHLEPGYPAVRCTALLAASPFTLREEEQNPRASRLRSRNLSKRGLLQRRTTSWEP